MMKGKHPSFTVPKAKRRQRMPDYYALSMFSRGPTFTKSMACRPKDHWHIRLPVLKCPVDRQ
jgi:hypothetical protein